MATKALIHFKEDGVALYVHHDGYPKGMADKLAIAMAMQHEETLAKAFEESFSCLRVPDCSIEGSDVKYKYLIRRDGSLRVTRIETTNSLRLRLWDHDLIFDSSEFDSVKAFVDHYLK